MSDTGFKGPTSAVNVAASDQTSGSVWNGTGGYGGGSPGNPAPSVLGTRDAQWGAAYYIGATPTITPYLYASGFDFSAIPDGATIDGVELEFAGWKEVNGNCRFNKVFLTTDGSTMLGTEQSGGYASQTNWSTDNTAGVGTVRSFGGATNKWGATLTPAIVKASNFGVSMQARGTTTDESGGYVDEFALKVYWSVPTVIESRTGTISGTATVSGVSGAVTPSTGSISATSALAGLSGTILSATGAIVAGASLGGLSFAVASSIGSIAGSGALAGQSNAIAATGGNITASASLSGLSSFIVPALGSIQAAASLSGVGGMVLSSLGSIQAVATLSGLSGGVASATGSIAASLTVTGLSAYKVPRTGSITATLTVVGIGASAVPIVDSPAQVAAVYDVGLSSVTIYGIAAQNAEV